MSETPLRVLVVDDQQLVREGLTALRAAAGGHAMFDPAVADRLAAWYILAPAGRRRSA